jgi:nucleoside-diphosphate-sugar epimerase
MKRREPVAQSPGGVKRRVLVTGANGFIGSHLVEYLIEQHWEVRCLVRRKSDLRYLSHLNVDLTYGDCRRIDSLYEAVRDRDVVFHLAAELRGRDWEEFYRTNVEGTNNLLEACMKVSPRLQRFVYVSTIAAAGPTYTAEYRNEYAPCHPVHDYGRTKLLGEEAVRRFGDRIPSVIIRATNIYGPRERELFPIMQIVQKRLKPLIGRREKQITICYVSDLVHALFLAAVSEKAVGNLYYVTDGKSYSFREIVDFIAVELGVSGFILPLPHQILILIVFALQLIASLTNRKSFFRMERLRHLRRAYLLFDGSRAEHDLGFTPTVSLQEGLRRTIDWFREEGRLS